mgnify:FL=1
MDMNRASQDEELIDDILRLQQGEEMLREDLIRQLNPFLIHIISRVTGRYVDVHNAPEYSAGLEALSDALDRFEPDRGNFLSFASVLVRNRVLDGIRQENRHGNTVPLEGVLEETLASPEDFTERLSLKDEIQRFSRILDQWGIAFDDLPESSPRHRDTRESMQQLSVEIWKDPALMESFRNRRRLPRKEIRRKLGVSDRVLTAHRSYVTACVLLLDSGLEEIRQYLLPLEVNRDAEKSPDSGNTK